MTAAASDPAIERYLEELRRATQHLAPRRREELVEEIEAHIREALPPDARETDVRDVLERLGDPRAIAEEEGRRLGIERPRAGAHEWLAVIFLLVGGLVPIVPVVGWLVGLVLLWASRVWTTREKLIGTFVLPGGLVPAAYFFLFPVTIGSMRCRSITRQTEGGARLAMILCEQGRVTEIVAMAVLALLVLAPVLAALYLVRRALATAR